MLWKTYCCEDTLYWPFLADKYLKFHSTGNLSLLKIIFLVLLRNGKAIFSRDMQYQIQLESWIRERCYSSITFVLYQTALPNSSAIKWIVLSILPYANKRCIWLDVNDEVDILHQSCECSHNAINIHLRRTYFSSPSIWFLLAIRKAIMVVDLWSTIWTFPYRGIYLSR